MNVPSKYWQDEMLEIIASLKRSIDAFDNEYKQINAMRFDLGVLEDIVRRELNADCRRDS